MLRAEPGDLLSEIVSLGAHDNLDDPAGTYDPKGTVFTQGIFVHQSRVSNLYPQPGDAGFQFDDVCVPPKGGKHLRSF